MTEFATAGHQWITFYEGAFEGTIIKQYVYLGVEPIHAAIDLYERDAERRGG